jgi:hypothetical protein
MRHDQRRQHDLFELQAIVLPLPSTLQAKLAPLLQALLMEAVGIARVGSDGRETGDDQDHA